MRRLAPALLCVIAAAPAGAHHRPAPEPGCAGSNLSDARGDSPRADTDLLEGFLAARDGRLTYSLRLAGLPEGESPGHLGTVRVNLQFVGNGATQHATADITRDGAQFQMTRGDTPMQPSTGDVRRGAPALVTFDLPYPVDTAIGKVQATTQPGNELPHDDSAAGGSTRATCPQPSPPAARAPEPARPTVRLRAVPRGFVVVVRPASKGTVRLLRDGRRIRTAAMTGERLRIRVPRRRGVYRATFAPDGGGPGARSRPLRIRR